MLAGMASGAGQTWSRAFEPSRNLIAAVSNLWGTAQVAAFDCANDSLGRRTRRLDTTPALSVTNSFGYNARSEVTEAVMYTHTYGYVFDPIGNRIQSAVGNGQSAMREEGREFVSSFVR